jgi:hypothetical protein
MTTVGRSQRLPKFRKAIGKKKPGGKDAKPAPKTKTAEGNCRKKKTWVPFAMERKATLRLPAI